MFRKFSKISFFLILAALLALAVFFVNCGDDDDDNDDDDDDDDDDANDDAVGWPDNTAPVVGWVAIYTWSPNLPNYAWDALYEIREEDYVEVTPPGNVPFFAGSLATRDVGWALNKKTELNELYRLDSGVWTLMDPQPPCSWTEGDIYSTIQGVQVFPDEKGYVLCGGGHLMAWDGEIWMNHDLPNAEDSDGYQSGIDCLAWDDCVVWNYDDIYWWDGVVFTTENKYDTVQMVMQNPQVVYRISNYVSDDANIYSIEVLRDGVWMKEDIHFPDNIDYYASMTRIDEHYTSFVYSHNSESVYVILKDDGAEAPESWPTPMWPVAFAEGAGGLGVSNNIVYRIFGTEVEAIFNHGFSGSNVLILAADAE